MAAANTDKLRKKKSNFSTTLNGGIDSDDTTITLTSTTGLPTGTAVTLTINRVDSNGTATPSLMERITGVVSGSTIISVLRAQDGTTAKSHSSGAVVEDLWDADTWNDAVDAFLAEHDQAGEHTSGFTTIQRNSNANVDDISNKKLNLIEGPNVDIRPVQNSANDRINLTIDAGKLQVGVWAASNNISAVTAMESDLGVTFDYMSIYQTLNSSIDYTKVTAALDAGKDVLYVVQFGTAGGAANLADINNGDWDTYFNSLCDSAVADGREVKVAIFHEFNDDSYPWAIYTSGNSGSAFVTAFQRIVGLAQAKGAPFKFVQWWNRQNANEAALAFDTYYVGDAYVDYIAVSSYNRAGVTYDFFHMFDWAFDQWYECMSRVTRKPMIIGETSTTSTGGSKPEWIKKTFDIIRTRYPKVRFLTWFLEDKSGSGSGNWTLQTQEQEDAFTEGWNNVHNRTPEPKDMNPGIIGHNLVTDPLITGTSAWSQSGSDTGTLGTSTDVPYNAPYGANSLTITDDGDSGNAYDNEVYQSHSDANFYPDETQMTLSFWAKSSVDDTVLDAGIKMNTSPNTTKGFQNLKLTTYWKRYSIVIDASLTDTVWRIPSFRLGHNSASCTVYFYGIKYEKGHVASAFVHEAIENTRTQYNDGLKTDTIYETTTGSGVTVDGILIKDDLDTSGIVAKGAVNQTIGGVKTFSTQIIVPTIPTGLTDGVNATYANRSYMQSVLAPSGAVAETIPRQYLFTGVGGSVLSSGRLSLFAIPLRKGQVVTTITFCSGGTALDTGSNQWFALYSSARAKLAVTNDDTSTAWGTNTFKTLTLTSPYTVTADGLFYVGVCVVASTPPSIFGLTNNQVLTGVAPILSGHSSTGLTDPASAPTTANALTAHTSIAYAYVS